MFRPTLRKSVVIFAVSTGALLLTPSPGSAGMLPENASGVRGGPSGGHNSGQEPAEQAGQDEPDTGDSGEEPATPSGRSIIDIAERQAGKPYGWGATGPSRFDCSGLTQYVHGKAGIDLPRTARQQRAALPHLARSELRPGDLLFFHSNGTVYHVGIFAGKGKMWAAPEPGDVVRLQYIWTQSFTVGRAW